MGFSVFFYVPMVLIVIFSSATIVVLFNRRRKREAIISKNFVSGRAPRYSTNERYRYYCNRITRKSKIWPRKTLNIELGLGPESKLN